MIFAHKHTKTPFFPLSFFYFFHLWHIHTFSTSMLISWQRCMFDFGHTHIYIYIHTHTHKHTYARQFVKVVPDRKRVLCGHHQLAFVLILFSFFLFLFVSVLNGTDWNMWECVCVVSSLRTHNEVNARERVVSRSYPVTMHTYALTSRECTQLSGVFSRSDFSLFFSSFSFCYLLVV